MAGLQYITTGEFERWRREETEYRNQIKSDITEILGLVRQQNGRQSETERIIAILQRDIDAIKAEDVSIDKTVNRILNEGCNQYQTHNHALGVLEGAGVLPNTDGAATHPRFFFSNLSNKQKVGLGVGASALMLPAIAELFRMVQTIFAWLVHIHESTGGIK